MTPFELTRYLDYCSEMLSLTAKIAALYAQSSSDAVVIDAVRGDPAWNEGNYWVYQAAEEAAGKASAPVK